VQAYPRTQLAERCGEFRDTRGHGAAAPLRLAIFDVDAVGACVLRYDEQLAYAGAYESLGFAENVGRRAANEVTA
jgi:hypothetical protein